MIERRQEVVTQAYRNLPSVDKVLALPELKELIDSLPQETVTSLVRHELASARAAIKGGGVAPEAAALAASTSITNKLSL